RKMNIPTVVTLHGISTEKKLYVGKTRKLLFENTLSNADRVVVVGKPLLDFSKEFVTNLHHFRVVGNGFRQSNNNNRVVKKIFIENVIHFISVSNLEEGKGIDINLHALAKLKKSGMTHWTYKIVGDGAEQKKLKKLTNELNLKDHVTFIGACDHHEVYSHLQQSDAFILPSYREAFGVAYLEAMSCGLLTLGVKGQGPEEFIEHEKTGLLVDPKNVDALTNMLKYILESPKNMIDIANNGKQHVHRYFTWHAHAKNLENVYRELL
ncbi:MAG: glycosyl transferase group 1, partial [uncultured bacterium]